MGERFKTEGYSIYLSGSLQVRADGVGKAASLSERVMADIKREDDAGTQGVGINAPVIVAERRLQLHVLFLLRRTDDDGLAVDVDVPLVAHALVVTQVPGQRPVV